VTLLVVAAQPVDELFHVTLRHIHIGKRLKRERLIGCRVVLVAHKPVHPVCIGPVGFHCHGVKAFLLK